jgi:hypothetical protein
MRMNGHILVSRDVIDIERGYDRALPFARNAGILTVSTNGKRNLRFEKTFRRRGHAEAGQGIALPARFLQAAKAEQTRQLVDRPREVESMTHSASILTIGG